MEKLQEIFVKVTQKEYGYNRLLDMIQILIQIKDIKD